MKLLAFVAFNRTFFFFFKVIRWESVALQMQFTLCDFVLFTHLWKVWNICFWFERSFRSHGRAAWFPAVCVLAPWQLCGASGALGTGWHSLPAPDPPVPLSAPWHALFHKSSPSVYHITYIVEHSISFSFFFFKSRTLFDWIWWHQRQICGRILNGEKSISAVWILRSKLWFPDSLSIELDKLDELKKLYWLIYLPPSQSSVCECSWFSISFLALQIINLKVCKKFHKQRWRSLKYQTFRVLNKQAVRRWKTIQMFWLFPNCS